jgi:threonine dehydratase
MADTPTTNGVQTPQTPKQQHAGLALTEYSAQPSPPSSTPKAEEAKVPKEFLLPNGYPDVRICPETMVDIFLTMHSTFV